MPKFFISQEQIDGNNLKIKGKDVNHIRNVLRKKINDEITVCNIDNQKDYLCTINELEKRIYKLHNCNRIRKKCRVKC